MKNKQNPRHDAVRYSSLGIQMITIIGLFVWLGRWLDEKYAMEKPLWTAGLALVGVVVALAAVIRELGRK